MDSDSRVPASAASGTAARGLPLRTRASARKKPSGA